MLAEWLGDGAMQGAGCGDFKRPRGKVCYGFPLWLKCIFLFCVTEPTFYLFFIFSFIVEGQWMMHVDMHEQTASDAKAGVWHASIGLLH